MVASGPGQSFVISVFVDDMLEGTDLSRTTFSLLYAAGTVVSAAAMLAIGRLTDRLGLCPLWIAVCVGLASACLLASVAYGLVVAFFALALLRTFGQGSFPLLGTLLVARSFRGRRGQAMAAASLGLTVASVALPPAAVGLILAFGWRDAYRVLAIALVVLVLPLAWLIRLPRREGEETDSPAGKPRQSGYPRALRRSRALKFKPPRRLDGARAREGRSSLTSRANPPVSRVVPVDRETESPALRRRGVRTLASQLSPRVSVVGVGLARGSPRR